jgi:diguanylate cyclase (GGDEF)-like protein
MLTTVKSIVSIGTNLTSNPSLKRKILHCNISVLLAFWTLFFFLVIYTLSGDPLLRIVVYYEMPFLALYLSPLWLNSLGKHRLASWTLMILLMISMAISIHKGVGTEYNIHLYYILFAIVPIALFPRSQWKSALLLCLINTAIYIYYNTHAITSPPSFQPLDADWKLLIISCVSTSVACTTFFLFWLADSIAERSELDIEKMAMTDPLTSLPNRRAFEIVLKQEIAQSIRNGEPLALAMLDIDHFKKINDTYGHDVGDEVLRYVAQILMNSTRSGNMIARIGGEEFCMLLHNTSLADAVEVIERTRRLIEEGAHIHNGQELRFTISAGVSLINVRQPIERAYKASDDALYRAKKNGRNRVELG